MEFFEYVRALGHIWYMHPLLWWYSTFFYSFMLTVHLIEDSTYVAHGAIYYLIGSQAVVCLMLGILSCIYRTDQHYERRGYIAVSNQNLRNTLLLSEENLKPITNKNTLVFT